MRTSSLPAPQAQGYDSTRRKPPRFFLLGVAALPAPPTWVAQAGSMNGLLAESTPKEILGCKASEDKTRVLCLRLLRYRARSAEVPAASQAAC